MENLPAMTKLFFSFLFVYSLVMLVFAYFLFKYKKKVTIEDVDKVLNTVSSMDTEKDCIAFARWLLKHAETSGDKRGFLAWKYKGELNTTRNMYFIYQFETEKKNTNEQSGISEKV